MSDTNWSSVPWVPLEIIKREVAALMANLDAPSIRVWRYVDSQKVLFNCWPPQSDATASEPPFEDRVAFLRDPEELKKHASRPVVPLSDRIGDSNQFMHPLWHLVPEYHHLPKNTRERYIESILVSDPSRSEQSPDDLVGVVCIDAPYSNYERLPDASSDRAPSKERVVRSLARIREALRSYAQLEFRAGLPLPESDPGPRESRDRRRQSDVFLREEIQRLLQYLQLDGAVSIYLRAVSHKWDEISLTGGFGDLYSALDIIEARLRKDGGTALAPNLFSYFVWREFEARPDSNDPVLFPGSGGELGTYEKYRQLFVSSGVALGAVPAGADEALRDACAQVREITERIVVRGSFGVFPIRSLLDSHLRGQLVGLACVAIENRRNVFTWSRRQLIERFCRMVGRRHDAHISRVINRVGEQTHLDLIASPRTLRKLLDDPGPLVRHEEADADERSCLAYVVSVDLRKSTELMLKVVPEHTRSYAREFMHLCEQMRTVMTDEFGIFDKFTGDGVLAFFPAFFSGTPDDAGYRAVRAAEACHQLFADAYHRLWPYLVSVPVEGHQGGPLLPGSVGLGIGIDYGRVRLVNVGDELTIVGVPVVYACRLSGAAAACTTLLNNRAFDTLEKNNMLQFLECTRDAAGMKHEDGQSLAYRVILETPERYRPREWNLIHGPVDEQSWPL